MKYFKYSLFAIVGFILLLIPIYFVTDKIQEPSLMDEVARTKAPGSFVTLSRGITHYQFYGPENGELVILIHGGGVAGCEVWSNTIPALIGNGYRVLCYDLYGRGYSDRIRANYTPKLIYNQFTELLEKLNISQSFYLFGQSMGSIPATLYTVDHPEKVKKLVYIAPAALGGYTTKWYLNTPILENLLMTFYWYPQSIKSQMEEFYIPEKAERYKKELIFFKKFKGYKDVNLSTWKNTYTQSLENDIKKIGSKDVETLLIMGREDPLIPVKVKDIYIKSIPTLRCEIIEEAGHMPHLEEPEKVNAIILNFLK